MRRGFGIWMALAVILVVGTLMGVTMKFASVVPLHTVDSYNRERAELFLQSAFEAALLQISGHDRSAGGCLGSVRILSSDGLFAADITVSRYYLLAGSSDASLCGALTRPIETEDSHGMVMLEGVVTSRDNSRIAAPIRLIRRSLQRP